MSGYIPSNDSEFQKWLVKFATGLSAHFTEVGLVDADVLPVEGVSTAFTGTLTVYEAQRTAMTAASNDKKSKRISAESVVRPLVQRIQRHPGMTDQLRGVLGLPLRNSGGGIVVAMPPDVPQMKLETKPGAVLVHFGTDPSNERKNGKPAGVKGCNIWRMKADETEYQLVAFQSASPYKDTITGNGSDYTYVVQYRGNKASDLGEVSVPGTIAARGGLVEQAA